MPEQKFYSCPHCARGCSLDVLIQDDTVRVSGNACARGEEFGRQEAIMPMRPLATSIRAVGGVRPRLQVYGTGDIPLAQLLEAMNALDELTVAAPVVTGQLVMRDLLGLGVDIVAKETLPEATT
jgi:CxxC motif-containing protein